MKAQQELVLSPFPCLRWWVYYLRLGEIHYHPTLSYNKTRPQNRYLLSGIQGPRLLSLPLLGGRNQKVAFEELRIVPEDHWELIHWRTMESLYGRSPFFEFYAPAIESLFQIHQEPLNLMQWSLKGLRMILELIGVRMEIKPVQSLLDTVNLASSLGLQHPSEPDKMEYQQVFSKRTGFLPNCSILDLLFCVGPEAINFLTPKS